MTCLGRKRLEKSYEWKMTGGAPHTPCSFGWTEASTNEPTCGGRDAALEDIFCLSLKARMMNETDVFIWHDGRDSFLPAGWS